MTSLDQYHRAGLQAYQEDEYLCDLLTFVTYPNPLWDWIHVWPLLGLPQNQAAEREDTDRKRLHLMGLKPQYDPYRHILSDFLTDQERAGQYMVTKEYYTRVALKMAKYLFEPKKP
jgi:hypothetical protein